MDAAPEDAEVRLLVCAAFTRLGLRTPALEHASRLPDAVRRDQGVRELLGVAEALSPDELTADDRVRMCRRNINALRARGVDLRDAFEQWAQTADAVQAYRCTTGNIVIRRTDMEGAAAWLLLRDALGSVESVAVRTPGADPVATQEPPCAVEGVSPPWLFRRVARELRPTANGYHPRLLLLQANTREFLDGLSLCDLTRELSEPRVSVFVGEGAGDRLAAFLRDHAHTRLSGRLFTTPETRTRFSPASETLFEQAVRDQEAEHARLRDEVFEKYAMRDAAWLADRIGRGLRGEVPLRVLIPTCRFSTFIRHSAEDLAEALREIGHEAEVLMEPDASSLLSSVGYLRTIRAFLPDLVLSINYPRATTDHLLPKSLPVVCWVQDSMPHLFTQETAAKQGPFDVLAGHLGEPMFNAGFRRDRAMQCTVSVSRRKFHPAPVTTTLRNEHECEVAYVGHQSEPVDQLRGRLAELQSKSAAFTPAIDWLERRVRRLLDRQPRQSNLYKTLSRDTMIALEDIVDDRPSPALVRTVFEKFTMPLADRIFRHQMLEWAAEMARRRGWRFHLYGRGWEKHPALREFCRGGIEHGEPLRASYQCATTHLHASIHTIAHQRVIECVMSGGLPLSRLHDGDINRTVRWTCAQVLERVHDAPDETVLAVADHPEMLALRSLAQRLGREASACEFSVKSLRQRVHDTPHETPRDLLPSWLLGDLAELTFWSRETLETRIERAIERPAWRSNASRSIAARALRAHSLDVFAARLLERLHEVAAEEAGGFKPV